MRFAGDARLAAGEIHDRRTVSGLDVAGQRAAAAAFRIVRMGAHAHHAQRIGRHGTRPGSLCRQSRPRRGHRGRRLHHKTTSRKHGCRHNRSSLNGIIHPSLVSRLARGETVMQCTTRPASPPAQPRASGLRRARIAASAPRLQPRQSLAVIASHRHIAFCHSRRSARDRETRRCRPERSSKLPPCSGSCGQAGLLSSSPLRT